MMESAVTLFPQPDSPTMPSVRPASREKLTPSTARSVPPSTAKSVLSSFTSSNLFLDDGAVGDPRGPRPGGEAAHERLVALEAHLVEAAQLRERLRVVVDAQV